MKHLHHAGYGLMSACVLLCGCGAPEAYHGQDAGRLGDRPGDGGTGGTEGATPDAAVVPRDAGPRLPIFDPSVDHGSVTITGHVNGGLFSMEREPVEICVLDRDDYECVETDAFGYYAIEGPALAKVALTITGAGLTPTVRAFVTTDEDLELGNTRVVGEAGLIGVADAIGVEYEPDKGAVFFGGVEFVSVALEPHSGERFFIDVAGRLLEDAVWLESRGSGGFFNVDPGLTAMRFARPHYECAFHADNSLSGWPDPDDPGIAIVPILPGHHTSLISMYCGDP